MSASGIRTVRFFTAAFFLVAAKQDLLSQDIIKRASVRTIPAAESRFTAFTHEVKVTLERPMAFDSISDPSSYRLYRIDQPLTALRIDRVSNAVGESSPEFVILYGTFAAESLGLDATFPGIGHQVVGVSSPEAPPGATGLLAKTVQWLRQRTRLNFDVREIAQRNGGLGVDYDVDVTVLRLRDIFGAGLPTRVSVSSAGKLGSDSASTPNTVEGSIVATALGKFNAGRDEAVYYGFRVPVGFESTQNAFADSLRGTVKLQAVMSVPFVSRIVLWWDRAMDVNESFLPPLIYAGYTQSFGASSAGRFDSQLKTSLPLGSEMTLELDVRASRVGGVWETFHEVSTGITTSRVSKLLFKYAEGKLAPAFQYAKNYGLGFGLNF